MLASRSSSRGRCLRSLLLSVTMCPFSLSVVIRASPSCHLTVSWSHAQHTKIVENKTAADRSSRWCSRPACDDAPVRLDFTHVRIQRSSQQTYSTQTNAVPIFLFALRRKCGRRDTESGASAILRPEIHQTKRTLTKRRNHRSSPPEDRRTR